MLISTGEILDEQQIKAIEAINNDHPLIMLPSKSGSGKTFILIKMVEALNPKSGKYLAYNKKVAVEAASKLSHTNVIASTMHSMAHQAVMGKHSNNTGELIGGKLYKRFIGAFSDSSVKSRNKKLSKDECCEIVYNLKKFFLSSHLTFYDYLEHNDHILSNDGIKAAIAYMKQMRTGHAPCSHDFYLKLYHAMLVSGQINPPIEDILLIDEAGDLAAVSYEIFMAYPAKKKVMAGDKYQNIYTFNHTINAFDLAKDIGHTIEFNKTFRVDQHIAESIQWFCQENIDPTFSFIGENIPDKTIRTTMYVTKTNAYLIERMIQLNNKGIGYNVARKVSSIFELPLLLLAMSSHPERLIDSELDFIIPDVHMWLYHRDKISSRHRSLLGFIASMHSKSIQVKSAISLILKFGPETLITAKKLAVEYEQTNINYPLTIGTCHSLKGSQADSVEIADDLNKMVSRVLVREPSKRNKDDYTSLLLYYVAVSRARLELINATHIY